ncbi:hypothetical protein [Escherichia coli]|uniref:hypothetical protein n=1 Tax=Escherichia coli TaxID=562 RepID=UPI00202E09B0|nr:hypothetical protein [Escherichia coli]
MNEKNCPMFFTIDTRILHNSNEKITEIFIAKYKDGITYHFGPDMERFQSCFEAALLLLVNGKKS